MKTTMFYLIQVFHQSLLLQMYENDNVRFNSGVSPNFTITETPELNRTLLFSYICNSKDW